MIKFITSESASTTVEEIMDCVNNYVNQGEPPKEALSYNIQREYNNLLDLANCVAQNQILSPDNPITAQGKMIGIKIFVKKILRKFMKWYMKDIIAQQMVFNESVSKCIHQELYIINQMNAELISLRSMVGEAESEAANE